MIYICPICNKSFKARPARQKRSKVVCCSFQCSYKVAIGRKRPKDICEKISIATKGKNNPFYGKKHSKKTKAKISKNRKGKHCGSEHHGWNGGIHLGSNGYILLRRPTHPFALKNGYVLESRIVAESILNRFLKPTEIIHHIDENKQNDAPSNLYLFESKSVHNRYHTTLRYHPERKIFKTNLY